MLHSLTNRLRKVLSPVLVPIHPAGYPFIALFAVFAILLWWIATSLGWLGLILLAWCVYFFRDPQRHTPITPGLVISPADGIIAEIAEIDRPDEIKEHLPDGRVLKIGVFMNVFDVHVNRAPVSGTVTYLGYYPGSFLDASLDKASSQNERQLVVAQTDWLDSQNQPATVAFVQIAGLVARRIVCNLDIGDRLHVGERFGLIRFGSRVDVYLPMSAAIAVAVGQRMIAGQTVLAHLDRFPEQGWSTTQVQ